MSSFHLSLHGESYVSYANITIKGKYFPEKKVFDFAELDLDNRVFEGFIDWKKNSPFYGEASRLYNLKLSDDLEEIEGMSRINKTTTGHKKNSKTFEESNLYYRKYNGYDPFPKEKVVPKKEPPSSPWRIVIGVGIFLCVFGIIGTTVYRYVNPMKKTRRT